MFDFRTDYREDGFVQITNVEEFQTVLNVSLTVRDWETLTSVNFWKRNNFWGSPAFFENALRFSKPGSFNPNLFMRIPVKVLSELSALLTREKENIFGLANCSSFFSRPLNSTFNPRFAYKLKRKSPWDSSTIEITTIKVLSLSTRANKYFRTTRFLNITFISEYKKVIHRDLKWIHQN